MENLIENQTHEIKVITKNCNLIGLYDTTKTDYFRYILNEDC